MDKMDVGKRLALAARHVAYGEDLVYSGPIVQSVTKDGAGLRVEFHDVGSGLAIGTSPWVGPRAPVLPTDHLVGFEVAGADGKWLPADAKIDGNAVVVSNAAVASPAAVRYDWKAYPEGNLYNKEGLPAPPFQGKAQ
jgi:sialate O-acetylesterase